jgi:DNA-binding NarL/FixJ family response regulator
VLVGECDRALGDAVGRDRRLELLGRVDHAAAAVARALELMPQVLVLDEDLADGALSAAVEIGARLPGLPLVVAHGDVEDGNGLIEALAAGASAYVPRDAAGLAEAIVEVAQGDVVLTKHQAARVVDALRDPTRPRRRLENVPELTAREWQVLELMNSEFSTPEIAERLVLSPVTVRSHARSIRNKLAHLGEVHHAVM